MKRAVIVTLASLALAGSAGFLTAQALSSQAQPTRTVTINLRNGATGPAGPRGPTGPAGSQSCPAGFSEGELVINHPGGQVTIVTCLKN